MVLSNSDVLRLFGKTVVLVSLISLIGCGQSAEDLVKDGIEAKISKSYARELVDPSVEIKAFENLGTEVKPEYSSRFVAKVKLREARYKKVNMLYVGEDEFTQVSRIYDEGDTLQAFGTSSSVLKAEELITNVVISSFDSEDIGHPLSDFHKPVVEGSEGYKIVTDEIKRLDDIRGVAVLELRKKMYGTWAGTYTCDGEENDFSLELVNIYDTGTESGMVFEARYVGAKDSDSPPSSFSLVGRLDLDGSFKLDPDKWINRIGNEYWAGFKGKYDKNTESVTGEITRTNNCSNFKLSRI